MSTEKRSGISFTGALFIAFLVLKLTNHIDWSWWWVTAPLWVNGLIFLILALEPKPALPKRKTKFEAWIEAAKEKQSNN